jgi:hypothetical protein
LKIYSKKDIEAEIKEVVSGYLFKNINIIFTFALLNSNDFTISW